MIFLEVHAENSIYSPSDSAVKKFKNKVSPANALPNPFNNPPPVLVSIFMPDVIYAIAPVSFFIVSPFCNVQITIGKEPPCILYSILNHINYFITNNLPNKIIWKFVQEFF